MVWGINGSGEVVGTFINGNGTLSGGSGFLCSNGVYTTIDDPSGVSTLAFGINDAGQIVGDYVDSSGGLHGFLYSDGTYTTIDDPLAATNSQGYGTLAFGIDNSGEIVGTYSDSSGLDHGFIASVASSPVIVSKGNSPYKISSGHTDTGDFVVSGGSMFVLSGGVANSTTVSSGGFLTISYGGTDSGTTLAGKETVLGARPDRHGGLAFVAR